MPGEHRACDRAHVDFVRTAHSRALLHFGFEAQTRSKTVDEPAGKNHFGVSMYKPLTINDFLDRALAAYPDRIAIVDEEV